MITRRGEQGGMLTGSIGGSLVPPIPVRPAEPDAPQQPEYTGSISWMGRALCAQTDPDAFTPEHKRGAAEQIALAKKVCRACGVQRPCLAWAITNDIEDGVWGGMTERERRALRKQGGLK